MKQKADDLVTPNQLTLPLPLLWESSDETLTSALNKPGGEFHFQLIHIQVGGETEVVSEKIAPDQLFSQTPSP